MLDNLFNDFDCIISLDTETTGLDFQNDKIIELSAVRCVRKDNQVTVTHQLDYLIKLPNNEKIPQLIVNLTGITDQMLEAEGVSENEACNDFASLFKDERILLVAYNAQFDMNFLYYFLKRQNKTGILKNIKMLDALTVYKDRKSYPHKLCNAIEAYSLEDKVQNSHRAIDDTLALVEVLKEMDAEEADLNKYINLFGYNPKHGISGKKISSVTYLPQPYNRPQGSKLYK